MPTCCNTPRGPRPELSFRIGKAASAVLTELDGRKLVVLSTPIEDAAPEGTLWMLLPAGYCVWSRESDCEVVPDFGKRFYVSTTTDDPHHFVMEW